MFHDITVNNKLEFYLVTLYNDTYYQYTYNDIINILNAFTKGYVNSVEDINDDREFFLKELVKINTGLIKKGKFNIIKNY